MGFIIPFTSKQQMKYMYATHPKIAEKMSKRQEKKSGKGVFKKLPNKAKKSKDDFNLDSFIIEDIQPIR